MTPFRANNFIKGWMEKVLDHHAKVLAALENNGDDATNTILCNLISLRNMSYIPEATVVTASFLSEPFQDGLSIAFGLVEADLSIMIAYQLTDSGL